MTPDYRLIRSARKTLSLEVTASGEVVVRAPTGSPNGRSTASPKAAPSGSGRRGSG
jgi:hypothetical protein